VEEYGRTEGLVHTRTPGCQDVITFNEQTSGTGESRGIAHFGFRLVSPTDIDRAVDEVERAGGKLLRRGKNRLRGCLTRGSQAQRFGQLLRSQLDGRLCRRCIGQSV
jgi:hypothetical protein